MRSFFTKKRSLIALAAIAVLALAGGAFAYFTSTGSGTGSASAGSNTALANAIQQTTPISGLVPGGGSQPVAFSITNPTSDGAQSLGKVTVTNISVDATHAAAGCLASWFSTAAPSSAVGPIDAGATYSSSTSTEPTVQMDDNTTTDQDACQGASLTLTLAAAQGS